MDTEKRLITVPYSLKYKDQLIDFCEKCDIVGYKNNNSLKAMKLDWCLSLGGRFFITLVDNKIVSLSGCHPLMELGRDAYRVLFRGVELPGYKNHLGIVSKSHMTSIPFFYHLPLQIEHAKAVGYKRFMITTNWDNIDGISSMTKSHRVLGLLARQGLVKPVVEKMLLYYTEQAVWEIDLDVYYDLREKFKNRHGL